MSPVYSKYGVHGHSFNMLGIYTAGSITSRFSRDGCLLVPCSKLRVVLHLDWFSAKAKDNCLPYYLNHGWWEEKIYSYLS